MSAHLALFPLEISRLTHRPSYSTSITQGPNKNEVRNANWQDPIYRYNAAFGVKNLTHVAQLEAFFHNVRGREQSFLLKDFLDYSVDDWTQFAETTDGVRNTFQLIKKYTTSGIGTYNRTITKPKQVEGAGGVEIRSNGVVQSVSDFSFSSSTGIVTLSGSPAPGVVVEHKCAEFYVPVRFDIDELPIDLLMFYLDASSNKRGQVEIPDIPLVEVRGE